VGVCRSARRRDDCGELACGAHELRRRRVPDADADAIFAHRRRALRGSVASRIDGRSPGPRPARAYAAGRDLFTREFSASEGLFGAQIARPLLPDGVTPVVPGGRVASCATCHNTPFRDAGAGPTIERTVRRGAARRTSSAQASSR